ncbi:MAG: hypothetical protein IRZ33_07220 [Alicyclobacillaceae bacterium]|nr:hypothetical protein [Alicyclobacillaceae bacterium]
MSDHISGDAAAAVHASSASGSASGSGSDGVGRSPKDRVRRNRLLLLGWIALVLALGGFFAHATIRALYVRSVTGSVFADYVIQHHIGRAQIADDESGFQKAFCVLTLNRPIPPARLEQEVANLMYHYHDLDGGTELLVAYRSGGKLVTQADAVYDESRQLLVMTLHAGGQSRSVQRHVSWTSSGAD